LLSQALVDFQPVDFVGVFSLAKKSPICSEAAWRGLLQVVGINC